MSWGVDVYLQLRQSREIKPSERGAMPLPEDVAAAMEQRADAVERIAASLGAAADRWMRVEPAEMRNLAEEVRAGTERGRDAFRAELLSLIAVKRGLLPARGVTLHLPPDVLEPFTIGAAAEELHSRHVRRHLDDLAETRELTDPVLRR